MRIGRIDLYEYFDVVRPSGAAGYLDVICHDKYNFCSDRVRPAMLVIAGGGYSAVSQREKEPIAEYYLHNGFNTFVLTYSVAPVTFPCQLIEAAMAMAFIREKADDYGVIKDKVAAVGFSAGGHLLGTLATMCDEREVIDALKNRAVNIKPDAVIYSYAVLNAKIYTHAGSIQNVSGGDKSVIDRIDIPNHITNGAPPAFIWATTEDAVVPVENSLMLAAAYRKNNVPFELHLFQKGQHGLSLCTKEVNSENKEAHEWLRLSMNWLKVHGFEIDKREV